MRIANNTTVTIVLNRQLTTLLINITAIIIAIIAIKYSIVTYLSLFITSLNCGGIGVENSIGLCVTG